MKQEIAVIVVGAGPAGLAVSACLSVQYIPNIVLEREDCCASLWKKRSYDRLKLHLAKQFCELPHMPYPPNAPTFIPKKGFIEYLDKYASRFNVHPLYNRNVESAYYDKVAHKWNVAAKNIKSDAIEEYTAKFLVVATGENSEGFIPKVLGLDSFLGEIMHSSHFENGKRFTNKNVLVVGSGNSGMEIAYDLSNSRACTSIVVRSPMHVLTKEMVQLGMHLLKYLSCNVVDNTILMLSKFKHGDLSEYGLQRPSKGPFYLKQTTGRSPVIDVGTIDKIKSGEIKVLPAITRIEGDQVEFADGRKSQFDAIVFATGYKSTVQEWLQEDDEGLFKENGMPKERPPHHWKGGKGIYCAGFATAGLFGISNDAVKIAEEIQGIISLNKGDN